jgi:transcriptional regulator with XRE-family HTH domain
LEDAVTHWTSANDESFISRITFDFVAQLENRLEVSGIPQSEMARKMNVSEGAVSQILNLNRTNLNLKTMVKCARALGMKVSVVAYDDGDPQNERGPVGSEIFVDCWETTGRPRDVWSLEWNLRTVATTQVAAGVWATLVYLDSTLSQNPIKKSASNCLQLTAPIEPFTTSLKGGTEAHARDQKLFV